MQKRRIRLEVLAAEFVIGWVIAAVALASLVASIRPLAFVYQGF